MTEESKLPPLTWRLLAGLEAGIAAACIMAVYLFAVNVLFGRTAWPLTSLLAELFLNAVRFRSSPGMILLLGGSLLLLMSGLQGVLFGLLVSPGVGTVWSANIGVFLSLGWYLVVLRGLITSWEPGLLDALVRPSLLLGYFLFGAVFACYPRLHYRISRPLAAPATPAVANPQHGDGNGTPNEPPSLEA